MSKWSENTTLKFVQEYLERECLWDFKCSNYRNKSEKQKALSELAEVMAIPNFGMKEVESKIKSIRFTYSQELKKVKDSSRSGSSTDDQYKLTLKWFDLLDQRLKSVNISYTRNTQNNMENSEELSITEHSASTENSQPEEQQFTAPNATPTVRKRKIRELHSIIDKATNLSKTISTTTPGSEHEFDVFGKSVGSQLKAMPLVLALQAQQHIQNYLCQLRLQELNSSGTPSPMHSYSYTPSPSPQYVESSPNHCTVPAISIPDSNYSYQSDNDIIQQALETISD